MTMAVILRSPHKFQDAGSASLYSCYHKSMHADAQIGQAAKSLTPQPDPLYIIYYARAANSCSVLGHATDQNLLVAVR